jgi:hypothetical protein
MVALFSWELNSPRITREAVSTVARPGKLTLCAEKTTRAFQGWRCAAMAVTLRRQAIAAASRRLGGIEVVRDTAMDAPVRAHGTE